MNLSLDGTMPKFGGSIKLKRNLEKVKISVNKKFKEWYTIIIRVTLQAGHRQPPSFRPFKFPGCYDLNRVSIRHANLLIERL